MATQITPFLMFQNGEAEAAMNFYVSLFPDGEVEQIKHYEAGQAGPEGSVMTAVLRIAGQRIVCFNSPVRHDFDFTPAISLFVECASESEFERLAAALSEDGHILMAPDNYGFSRRFTWVNDRYKVSWQLNLP
ncbi:VOC family protein [Bordetella genomosp. 9]|uniref:PhnB-like domain-containing protein n=1 Tax=Bordetella genomosp. 9 TaxID=1416803 RepID=A0A1W6YVA7_9BORD|nr:VOC family protein [Bordetella genomosp. 9]ARP84918.1 hypothetical protein CAL13_00770 [Bordetella genomosp. 9]ARP89005.1 hypothetical protein CAL14_00760 [Bordetella genomosp. 9]